MIPFEEPPAIVLEALPTGEALEALYPPLPGADDEGYVYGPARPAPWWGPDQLAGACWHPSDPEATRRWIAVVDHVGVPLLVEPEGVVGEWRTSSNILFTRNRCTVAGRLATEDPYFPSDAVIGGIGMTPQPRQELDQYAVAGGRICGLYDPHWFTGSARDDAWGCISAWAGLYQGRYRVVVESVFDLDALDGALGIAPFAGGPDGGDVQVYLSPGVYETGREAWRVVGTPRALSDGRFVALLGRKTIVSRPGVYEYRDRRWLVAIDPHGEGVSAVEPLVGPPGPLRDAFVDGWLEEVTEIFVDQRHDLVILPVHGVCDAAFAECRGFEHRNDPLPGGQDERDVWGYLGMAQGALVYDAVAGTFGYQSLTDEMYGRGIPYGSFLWSPEGTAVRVHHVPNPDVPDEVTAYLAQPDPLALDLDGDGLSASAEALRGTSDADLDSDADEIGDGAEVALGFDPSDPADPPYEPWPPVLGVTSSTLVQERFPGFDGTTEDLVRSHAPDAPLCALAPDGAVTCRDAAGRVVAAVTLPEHAYFPVIARDGRTLTWRHGADEIRTVDLRTSGRRAFALDRPALQPGEREELYPLDAHRLFLVVHGFDDPRVFACTDGACALVFRLSDAAAAAGLTTPAPIPAYPTLRLLPTNFHALGFDDLPTGEPGLILSVHATWRRYVLRLDFDGALAEVRRFRDGGLGYDGEVAVAAETDRGLFFGGGHLRGDGRARPVPLSATLWGGYGFFDRRVPALGTLLYDTTGIQDEGYEGLTEVVRFDERLAPGEALAFVSEWEPPPGWLDQDGISAGPPGMLFRVHPRGGMVPAWNFRDRLALDETFGEVTGMDVDARPWLCLADAGAGELRVYRSTLDGFVPDLLVERRAVPGITDCRWREDGGLSVLIESSGSSRVWTRPAGGTFAEDPSDPGAASPRRFVKGAGGLALVPASQAAFVAPPGAGGHAIAYDREARTVNSPWGTLQMPPPDPDSAVGDVPSVALRADGRLLVYPWFEEGGYVVFGIVDPRDGRVHRASVLDAARPFLRDEVIFAMVPYDALRDPWTGDALDPDDPLEALPVDDAPTPPMGGDPWSADPVDDARRCGCATGASPSPWLLLALLPWLRRGSGPGRTRRWATLGA